METGTPSELATSEMPVSDNAEGEATPVPPPVASFPPYPPYTTEPAPPSVADTIIAGRGLRLQHKSMPRKPVRPPPKPARPRGPKATDVKMTKRAMYAHTRCLRRHGAILTDRLERMAKPLRRNIIYLWREHAHTLPPETIARLRSMLDADEPFKPDQAYEYFVNLKKTKKKTAATAGVNEIKKDVLAMVGEKRFVWARNATVAFARGIQQRLSRPGRYALADGMLRLSNIILDDICGYMHMRTPSRRSMNPKAKFMMEMSDKVAVWIDEILSESDDRMLMMDFDEDEEVQRFYEDALRPEGELLGGDETPPAAGTAAGSAEPTTPSPASPAASQGSPVATPQSAVTPETAATPESAATPAETPTVTPGEPSPSQSQSATPGPTPKRRPLLLKSKPAHEKFHGVMKEAFQILTDTMDKKGNENLLSHGKFDQTFRQGADALKQAPDLEASNYNTSLASDVNKKLSAATNDVTPANIAPAMKEMVEIGSNFLAQNAEENKEKGPAFKLLVNAMRSRPSEKLYQNGKVERTNAEAAKELEKARSLEVDHDDPNLSQSLYTKMANLVANTTPGELKKDMADTLDVSSKYLSQKAVDEAERGPAFDLLIKELDKNGDETFSDDPALNTKNAAAYALATAPGLTRVPPDPSTAPKFKEALHKAVDAATPKQMQPEMKEVIERSGNYLSAFVRDRGAAIQNLLGMMKSKPKHVFAKRNDYTMDYKTGAEEIENAPTLVPYLPVKDIAEEGKKHLTKDMKKVTPPELKAPMQAAIQDVSKYLSQPVALRSGAAGERYPMNLLAAVKKSLGTRPLYKHKSYGQSYAQAADELQHAGPLESPQSASQENLEDNNKSVENLQHEIVSEMERGVPTRVAPSIAEGLNPTMKKAAKHLAKVGSEKGGAMEYLIDLMKEKGNALLAKLQGYNQSYTDGAKRIEDAPSLKRDKVDKGAYEDVKGKLNALAAEKPANKKLAEHLPELVDETAKYLAAPLPETQAEKREVLANLLGREEDKTLEEEGIYKMTYKEGGEEIKKSPVGVTKAHDEAKKKEIIKKVEAVIPDKKMKELLKEPTQEGAAHLADVIEGRGEAIKVIHDELKKEKDKEFIEVGEFKKTHEQAADMLAEAKKFGAEKPSPVILDKVEHQVSSLPKDIPSDKPMAKKHMEDATKIAAKYIASAATKESGLDAKQLAELDESGFNDDVKAAAAARKSGKSTGADGKGIGGIGADGKSIGGVGADGKSIGVVGADGKVVGGIGADGKGSGGIGADGKGVGGVGADGKGGGGIDADGKIIGGVSADGKGLGGIGADGMSIGGVGADGKGVGGIGADGKSVGGIGADGKSIGAVGADGKSIGGVGADGKSIGGVGADGMGVGGIDADGKSIGGVGADGKGVGGIGADGQGAGGVGADGKGARGFGADGKGGGSIGADGKSTGGVGADGKGVGGVGADGMGAYGTAGADGTGAYGMAGTGGTGSESAGADGTAAGGMGVGGVDVGGEGVKRAGGGGAGAEGTGAEGTDEEGTDAQRDGKRGGGKKGGGKGGVGKGGRSLGPGGVGSAFEYDPGDAGPIFGETEEQRRRRLAEAEVHRKYEEEERMRLGDKEYYRRQAEKRKREMEAGVAGTGKYRGGALGADYDPEHETALDILHNELRRHGTEVFYQQPQTGLTHRQASDWIAMPVPLRVDKTVKDSGDTTRLYKKFERKLSALVNNVTPEELYDSMQDVIIESARRLSEFFVSTNYKALVHEALISEMQKRGNEILTEVDGAAETFFFAAQRLKKSKTMDIHEPCYQVAHQLTKKLEDMIRCRSMARKLTATMKDHVKEAANFLSAQVTKPDDQIEAYIALLGEMEAAGDSMLIEGDIPKSYKEAAAYLRQLTSFEDLIARPNSSLQATIQDKLKSLMSNVTPSGYSQTVMDTVIAESAGLLVSSIMLQGAKTEALNLLVQEMEKMGDGVLLRHGPIRKSFTEGADMLRGKNAGELGVTGPDPVVSRKIQIKLNNLMQSNYSDMYHALMDDVIEDATSYLAVHFLQPQVIKVCKCMKNVFVQCELWCDEILRRVARPCCMCSRHVSAQALQDLAPAQRLRITPGSSLVFAPGLEISLTTCPSKQKPPNRTEPQKECPAAHPTPGCLQSATTSYLLYSTSTNKRFGYESIRHMSSSCSDSPACLSSPLQLSKHSSPFKTLLEDIHSDNIQLMQEERLIEQQQYMEPEKHQGPEAASPSFYTPDSIYLSETSQGTKSSPSYPASPMRMYANVQLPGSPPKIQIKLITQAKSGYSSLNYSTGTPIISTDQMADWHAMMVSLMWNVQAWRDWIQENIDRALVYRHNPNTSGAVTEDNWSAFQRRLSTEGLQWRQYSMFSRQLTTRLALRYKDKEKNGNTKSSINVMSDNFVDGTILNEQIVSPVRATVKTKTYLECQEETMEIIDIFNRWTQWLTLAVKETDSLHHITGSDVPLHEMRWHHLKKKVEEYSNDWIKYNMYLKVSWEQKYSTMIADHLPSWKQPGPVWVVSACGAVPSGAVAAGVFDGEVIWVARTTHRCNVLPAALYPSKHCCLVYADGAVHRYTKYQVMCNAEVRWVAWRGGSIGGRAVRVSAGVHVGRVHYRGDHLLGAVHEPHYRCQVVIFGRPFAFNCYELLMLADGEGQ